MSDAGSDDGKASNEHDLPKSTINKLISDALAGEIGSSKDVKDLIAEAAKEFITLVATESNTLADKTSKKTINAEHVTEALKTLGFSAYLPECEEVIKENVEVVKVEKQRQKNKANKAEGMTDEQLLAEQERLFAAARAKMETGE